MCVHLLTNLLVNFCLLAHLTRNNFIILSSWQIQKVSKSYILFFSLYQTPATFKEPPFLSIGEDSVNRLEFIPRCRKCASAAKWRISATNIGKAKLTMKDLILRHSVSATRKRPRTVLLVCFLAIKFSKSITGRPIL